MRTPNLVVLYVEDTARSVAFYEPIFGRAPAAAFPSSRWTMNVQWGCESTTRWPSGRRSFRWGGGAKDLVINIKAHSTKHNARLSFS